MEQILNIAPFKIAIETDVPLVAQNLAAMYPEDAFLANTDAHLADYSIGQNYSSFFRRFVKPQSTSRISAF